MWAYRGQGRPPFAEDPARGQESVWDYPRPPRVEKSRRLIEVRVESGLLARSDRAYRVLETASPPGFYLPLQDVDLERLAPVGGRSICEWKGVARYWALAGDLRGAPVAWSYGEPRPGFEVLRDCISFYPGRVECFVDGIRVRAQPGRFYGGWITPDVAGPFKGGPGSAWW